MIVAKGSKVMFMLFKNHLFIYLKKEKQNTYRDKFFTHTSAKYKNQAKEQKFSKITRHVRKNFKTITN